MFGGEAAVELANHFIDDGLHLVGAFLEGGVISAEGHGEIEMGIAVAEVSVGHDADAGELALALGGGAGDELRRFGNRHGDVVLDGRAFALLGVGDLFAQLPDGGTLG